MFTLGTFGTFGVHLMGSTWRPFTSFVRRRLAQKWEVWEMQQLIRQSRQLEKRGVSSSRQAYPTADSAPPQFLGRHRH